MVNSGRILVADDDETFLQSTCDLLRREGYQCDCVPDAAKAAEKLAGGEYDLLIADIKMSGNAELELIRSMPNIAEGMPVILVTGYPSLQSAIQSIGLPVESYLIKPFDFAELLSHVRIAVGHFQVYRSIHAIKQRLQCWNEEVGDVEELLKQEHKEGISMSLETFLELTFQNIVGTVSDLKYLAKTLAEYNRVADKRPCHLFNCPTVKSLSAGLAETIDVLEKSKSAFKSKDLGEIRKKLEGLVDSEAYPKK